MARLASQAFNAAVAFTIGGRHVVQHDDVGGGLLAAERGFPGDRLFDQPQARLDVLDQGDEVGHDRAVGVVPVVGFDRDAAALLRSA